MKEGKLLLIWEIITPGAFLVFPEDFLREFFNTSGIEDLPGISAEMCTLHESPGDIKDVGGWNVYNIERKTHRYLNCNITKI